MCNVHCVYIYIYTVYINMLLHSVYIYIYIYIYIYTHTQYNTIKVLTTDITGVELPISLLVCTLVKIKVD